MSEIKEISYKIFEQNGQLKLTLPKNIAQSVGLRKGDKIKYIVERGELVIRRI